MEHCRNPVGVARIVVAIPKVADYGNLGLRDAITVGLHLLFPISQCPVSSLKCPISNVQSQASTFRRGLQWGFHFTLFVLLGVFAPWWQEASLFTFC